MYYCGQLAHIKYKAIWYYFASPYCKEAGIEFDLLLRENNYAARSINNMSMEDKLKYNSYSKMKNYLFPPLPIPIEESPVEKKQQYNPKYGGNGYIEGMSNP